MTYLDESYPPDALYAPGPFALTGIAPSTAVANTAPITVSANGTNFTPFSRVVFDGKVIPSVLVGNTQLRFDAPSHAAGAVNVYVKNGGSITGTQVFTYTGAAGDEEPTPAQVVCGTIASVKAYVQTHPEQAQAVLDAERDNLNRTTLVTWLEEFIANATEEA